MASDSRINIAGTGSIAGGSYSDVHISGSGRISEAVDTETLRVSGTLVADAPLKARNIRVSGTATCLQDVEAGTVSVSGALTCGGNLTEDILKVSGVVEVAKNLHGGTVDIAGAINVSGDCEVEKFKSNGGFAIGGLLSADTVTAKMHGICTANEIGGETIDIRVGRVPLRGLVEALGLMGLTRLEAESIEGDRVYLERAEVRTVRGRSVTLGEGCDVDLVEYSGDFKQAPSAKVKTARKLEDAAVPQA